MVSKLRSLVSWRSRRETTGGPAPTILTSTAQPQPPPSSADGTNPGFPPPEPAATAMVLRCTRYGLPALVVAAGIIAICFGTQTSLVGGAALIGAGAAIWLVAWFYRVGVDGDRARETEEQARCYFDRYGRWPNQ